MNKRKWVIWYPACDDMDVGGFLTDNLKCTKWKTLEDRFDTWLANNFHIPNKIEPSSDWAHVRNHWQYLHKFSQTLQK